MVTVMAKKKTGNTDGKAVGSGGDDRSNRKSAPVQLEKELARMVAVIASHDGISQSELLSPILRPFLRAEYKRVQIAMEAMLDQE